MPRQLHMLTEPMTAAERAANKAEREEWDKLDAARMRLQRIERDMRDIADELLEQANGSQDGYLLDVAQRIRKALA